MLLVIGAVVSKLAYKWRVMITIIFGISMVVLDSTVVNVAFPTLRREFNVGLDQAQWIMSIYVLALGIATPLAGCLAERFKLKRVYIAGLCIFLLGSLVSGLAPSFWLLVGARALQGIGGGIALPLSTVMLFTTFEDHEQGRAFGIYGLVMVAAPAIGPILGGMLADTNLWRWIFFINMPIGLIGIGLAVTVLRAPEQKRSISFNPISLTTLIVGYGSVLYAASIVNHYGWISVPVLSFFAVAVVALSVFAIYDLKYAREPLLELRLFKDPTFLKANLVGYVAVIALFGAEFLMPVYLQSLRGRTAMQTGFILLPIAATTGVINLIVGGIYDKIGPRLLVIIGAAILLVNTWQFAGLSSSTSITQIVLLLVLRGVSISLITQPTFTIALGMVPKESVSRGSSLVNSNRFVVQALGVAVLATILGSTLSPEVKQFQHDLQNHESGFGLCEQQETNPQLRQACEENLSGLERAYRFTFCAALVAFMLGAFLPGYPNAWAGRGAIKIRLWPARPGRRFGLSPRSRQQHKAWGASPRIQIEKID
jgi:EmrB/QacA subfamily drug resistance transporter